MKTVTYVCSVCGMGGYWVAFSGEHQNYRCVNHIHEPVELKEVLDEQGKLA